MPNFPEPSSNGWPNVSSQFCMILIPPMLPVSYLSMVCQLERTSSARERCIPEEHTAERGKGSHQDARPFVLWRTCRAFVVVESSSLNSREPQPLAIYDVREPPTPPPPVATGPPAIKSSQCNGWDGMGSAERGRGGSGGESKGTRLRCGVLPCIRVSHRVHSGNAPLSKSSEARLNVNLREGTRQMTHGSNGKKS